MSVLEPTRREGNGGKRSRRRHRRLHHRHCRESIQMSAARDDDFFHGAFWGRRRRGIAVLPSVALPRPAHGARVLAEKQTTVARGQRHPRRVHARARACVCVRTDRGALRCYAGDARFPTGSRCAGSVHSLSRRAHSFVAGRLCFF